MRIGLQIPDFEWPGSPQNIGAKLIDIAKTADQVGFYSLWVMDHFFHDENPEGFMLEGYSTISYLAAVTHRIKIGVLVSGNIYHHPGILIKTVTTLDVLSGGRAYFGIGNGWYEREARGLGLAFPPAAERSKRLEETLQIAKQMWRGDTSPYRGEYYQLEEPINSPPPLSKPHPPILIGGRGEKRTLLLVAKYANASNFYFGSLVRNTPERQERYRNNAEQMQRKLDVLQKHCQTVGRPYAEIERTVLCTISLVPDGMSAPDIVEACHALAELGFQHVILNMPNVHEIEPLEIIGQEVIPQVASRLAKG
ncbi:MAG: TIGR03560 family F420-dependent LLM class oxidoreductase [Chloroflexi bacterium]|nr:TIGR03560 family F420-dependent LLM class oxidoreductase [Chloroflexota bacterium]